MPESKYLIDTNIYGLSFAKQFSTIPKFLKSLNPDDYVVSCFVLAELEAIKYSFFHPDFKDLIYSLQNSTVLWFQKEEMEIFGLLKHTMSTKNIKNRTIDYFLAAQCLYGDYTLVTANIKDFESIPNLKTKYFDQKNHRWLTKAI